MSGDAVAAAKNVADVRIENLRNQRAKVLEGGGKERIDKNSMLLESSQPESESTN